MTEPTIAELLERLSAAAIDDGVSEPIQPDEYGKLCTEAADALTALQQRLAEANRRLLHMATTNSDDYRWFKQQAQQACRAIGIESEKLDWDARGQT